MRIKFIIFFFITIIIIGLYLIFNSNPDFSSKKYNKKEWIDNPNNRIQMANNIITSKILIGKDSAQILNELGKFNNESSVVEWKYLLGYKGFLYPKFYFLTIHFNNGAVDDVFIETSDEN